MLLRDADRRKKLGEAARKRVLVDYDLAALQRSISTCAKKYRRSYFHGKRL